MSQGRSLSSVFLRLVDNGLVLFFNLVSLVSRVVPPRLIYAMTKGVAAAAYYGRSRARRNVKENISTALPGEHSGKDLDRIGRGAYEALFLCIPDLIYLAKEPERFLEGLEIEGMENLEKADAEGKGVLCLLVHHGNAHKHAFMYGVGRPYYLVGWHPDSTPVPRYTAKLTNTTTAISPGSEKYAIWVGKGFDTIGDVKRRLSEGDRVGVAFDVGGKRVVDFFGKPAAFADGIGHWVRDSGCPVVPVTLLHTDDPFRCRLVIMERLSYELTGEREADIQAIMQAAAEASEKIIRLAPEQWMSWFGIRQWWKDGSDLSTDGR